MPTVVDVPASAAAEAAAGGNGSPWHDEQMLEMASHSTAEHAASPAKPTQRPRAKLPLSFWLIAVLLPCVVLLVPAIGLLAYFKILERGQERAAHPLEALGDEGLYKDLQEGKRPEVINPLEELPKDVVPLRLGSTGRFGGLEVTPLEVLRQTLPYRYYRGAAGYVSNEEMLVLKLRIKNVSDIIFHPHDPTFNRAYKQGVQPYTYLMIGDKRFYGSVTDPLSERVQQQNFDELLPDREMTTIFVAAQDPAGNRVIDELRHAPPRQPLIWRVQLRKGREPIRGRQVWVTAVIPIEFSPGDVREAKPEPRSTAPTKDND